MFNNKSDSSKKALNSEPAEEPTTEIRTEPATIEIDRAQLTQETEPTEDVKIFSSTPKKSKPAKKNESEDVKVVPDKEDENNQMQWDDFVKPEEPAEEPDEGTSPEGDRALVEEFHRNRASKVKTFRVIHSLYLDEENETPPEEVIEPEEEFEEEYVEDYCSKEDRDAIDGELKYRKGKTNVALLITGVLELVLLLESGCFQLGILSDILIFLITSVTILLVMMGFNFRMFRNAWDDLKNRQISLELGTSFTCLIAVLETLLQFFCLDTSGFGLLPALAGLNLLFCVLADFFRAKRIAHNFSFVSSDDSRYIAEIIEDDKVSDEIGAAAVASGIPDLAYFRPVDFLHHFLGASYSRKPEITNLKKWLLISWGVLAAAALFFGLAAGKMWIALQLLCIGIILSVPSFLTAIRQGILWKVSRSCQINGGMLVGESAIEKFGPTDAVILPAIDLFPEENMILHGIRTFKGTRIDDAILDTASVVIASGGPLSHVFNRILENRDALLKNVENLITEQGMGLSGWVDGKRILVGNRKLLQNHGVDVPSRDYENRYIRDSRQLVYLSVAGSLSAMFIISYTENDEVSDALHLLARENMTILVETCDPNITEESVCSTFRLDPYYIEILGSNARRSFDNVLKNAEEDTENQPIGFVAGDASLCGKVVPLAKSKHLASVFPQLSVISCILSVVMLILTTIYVFSAQTAPSVFLLVLAVLVATLVTGLFALIRKV